MELFRLEYYADKTDGTLYWCTWHYTKRFPSLSLKLIRKAENKFMKSFYKTNFMYVTECTEVFSSLSLAQYSR